MQKLSTYDLAFAQSSQSFIYSFNFSLCLTVPKGSDVTEEPIINWN